MKAKLYESKYMVEEEVDLYSKPWYQVGSVHKWASGVTKKRDFSTSRVLVMFGKGVISYIVSLHSGPHATKNTKK